MVLDVDYDSDIWFGPLDLSNKSLMKKLAIWMSTLGVQAYTRSVQAKQWVRLAYILVRSAYSVKGILQVGPRVWVSCWAWVYELLLGLLRASVLDLEKIIGLREGSWKGWSQLGKLGHEGLFGFGP